ncbi:MAG: hypothetical protein ACRCRP_00835 [Metamycoplasmataceae bacterium]
MNEDDDDDDILATDPFWKNEIEVKTKELFENNFSNWIDNDIEKEFNNKTKEFNLSLKKYKKEHNDFCFFMLKYIGLPLTIIPCLFIPFPAALKKYKELKENKNKLKMFVNEQKDMKLNFHKKILENKDFINKMRDFNNIIKYKEIGSITDKLIHELQLSSLFLLVNNINENTFDSSWGVFDNNKIIINISKQTHVIIMKTYWGSKSVTTGSGKNKKTKLVVASYTHPKPIISFTKKQYLFMESCPSLEFNFEKKSIFNFKKNKSKLENNSFNKKTNWKRNEEVQFRMIFTPYAQEMFVLQISHQNEIEPHLKFKKTKSFFSNEYISNTDLDKFANIKEVLSLFSENENYTIEDFKNELYEQIINNIKEKYLQINFLWSIPILMSENQKHLIKNIEKSKINSDNLDFISHYVINKVLKIKLVSVDTKTFNTVIENKLITYLDKEYVISKIKGLSYKKNRKTKSVYKSGTFVNVPYFDYVPHEKYSEIIFHVFTNEKKLFYFSNKENNLDNHLIIDQLENLEKKGIQFIIRNNVLAGKIINFEDTEKINFEDIKEELENIINNI